MEVAATAYRILDVIGEPIDFAGQEVSHTASIGIVLSKPGVKNGIELLGWADVALYAAKRQGRNQAVVFDEVLRESVSERSRTELTLREAIEGDGLRLHYQPEVDLRTGKAARGRGPRPLAAPDARPAARRPPSSRWPRRPASWSTWAAGSSPRRAASWPCGGGSTRNCRWWSGSTCRRRSS